MSRTLNFFLDWDNPTTYAATISQSDGLNSDLNAQALTSKDYHKYEPRRAKVTFFRNDSVTNTVFGFPYITNSNGVSTKWNEYKVCIKDGDSIIFRGLIDNTSVKYKQGRKECSLTCHDIITLLNEGIDNLDKKFTWQEINTPQDIEALLAEIIEDSLSFGDETLTTPEDWYTLNYTIPSVTFDSALVYQLDVDAFEDMSNSVNFPNQYEWRWSEYTLRDDGDYVRLYCITEWATEDPTEPEGAQTINVQRRLHVYLIDSGQAIQDFSLNHFDQESIFVENNNEYTTNSGFTFSFPLGLQNYSVEREGLTYDYELNTGKVKATGTTQIKKVFLNKEGAAEEGTIGNSDDGLYQSYNLGGKYFSYRELFRMISYLWNLSIHTNSEGVVELTNKNRSGTSPSLTAISDSHLSGTEFKSLLYTQPDIEEIFEPLAQSGLNLVIKTLVDDQYKDIYGTKIIKTTVPASYNLGLESSFTAYGQQYKIAKIKHNKRGTFDEIEGWVE